MFVFVILTVDYKTYLQTPMRSAVNAEYYMHDSGGLFVVSAWLHIYQLNTLNEEERWRVRGEVNVPLLHLLHLRLRRLSP